MKKKLHLTFILSGFLASSLVASGQNSSANDATLKSLSYQIGEAPFSTPVADFSPTVFNYEVPYMSNEEAISQGRPPIYPEATPVYAIGTSTNEKAKVTNTNTLLSQGKCVKVQVESEDKTASNTYTLFMISRSDAGKKYYISSELKDLTLKTSQLKVDRNGVFEGTLVPDKGYKLPETITIESGNKILSSADGSISYSPESGKISMKVSWHTLIQAQGIDISPTFVFEGLKYKITGEKTVAVLDPDVAKNEDWTITACTIPEIVKHEDKTYQVTEIKSLAFANCKNMTSITLPAGLNNIGDRLFAGCNGTLKEVHCLNTEPIDLADNPLAFFFSSMEELSHNPWLYNCILYVPKGTKATYATAKRWENFGGILEEGEKIELEASEVTDSTILVKWNTYTGANGYSLKVYNDAEKTKLIAEYEFEADGQLRSSTLSYNLKGLAAGQIYYIEIAAVKGGHYPDPIIITQNTIQVKTSGISTGNTEIERDKPTVVAQDGQIIIHSASTVKVRIYTLSGTCLWHKKVSGTEHIQLPQNIYIVQIENKSYKISL